MFNEFKNKDEFYERYLNFYIDRFVYTSIDIENDNDKDITKSKKIDLLNAFKYVLNVPSDIPNVWDIQELGDLVNFGKVDDEEKESFDMPNGFRKIQVSAGSKATFVPVRPYEIIPRLYSLLNSYKNIWCDLDVFEKEAMFHIEFMRIHPFEDGNKRTAKTILNRNLIHNNKAPVIINDSETDQYYEFINNLDYIGFAEFLRKKSEFELTNMVGLFKMLYDVPVDIEGNALTLERNKK